MFLLLPPAVCQRPSTRTSHTQALATYATALLGAGWFAAAPQVQAADGTWIQAGGGTQQWSTTTNWLNGIVADGVGANALFHVNLVADQNIQLGAGGRTIGNLFFQDSTVASPDGGFGLGIAGDGAITVDVTSGRAVLAI